MLRRGIPIRCTAKVIRPLVTAFAAAALLVLPVGADAEDQTSSCVDCHTDANKLKIEAKGIPQPKGSALQSGKG